MDGMTRTLLALHATLATTLALGCAAPTADPDAGQPSPVPTAVEAGASPASTEAGVGTTAAAPVLEAPSAPLSLLDQGDPASLRTAVARSLAYLAELPGDSLIEFGVRAVPARRVHAALAALHDFLGTDPDPPALAEWIEARFDVVESVGNAEGEVLFTGYYEPVVPGCRERTEGCTVPVYGPPGDLVRIPLGAFGPDLPDRRLTGRVTDAGQVVPYYTRREIREEGALAGRGLEIAWVEDRVDLFFVEVQGSGAIRFPDGSELGIGVGASNGRPYRSIGRFLIDEGLVPAEEMSMQAIRRYLAAHPEEVPRVLTHNESFIFFRTRDTPPIGSLGQPVTPVRSIATDYRIFPRGALAFIDTRRPEVDSAGRIVDGEPLRRFMLNQDTGGAIRGPGRVDVFWGRGDDAAETAGRMQQTGRLFFLVPRSDAFDAAAAGRAGPLRVVVMSDLNSAYGSTRYEPEVHTAVRRTVEQWRPDLVLIAGDMVAGQKPSLSDERVRAMWAAFDSAVAEPLRRAGVPFAFTVGNHDASGHPGHERDRREAARHWQPSDLGVRVLEGGRFPFYYAFTQGDVFFLILDASTGAVAADSAQMAWVRRTLASEPARSAGMRVSLGHVPLYPVARGRDRPGEVQAQADSIRALLERGDVRLHISGHHHAYLPGRRGDLELLHAGALGQGARQLLAEGAGEPIRTVTVLELFPPEDRWAERTYRVDGYMVEPVDPGGLPARVGPPGDRLDRVQRPLFRVRYQQQ